MERKTKQAHQPRVEKEKWRFSQKLYSRLLACKRFEAYNNTLLVVVVVSMS
jgi:hypothetical protein